MQILRLNKAGMPEAWISREEAAKYYCQERVLFELGDVCETLHGGWNSLGEQSTLDLASIIACEGKISGETGRISLCNRFLFRRDNNICLYCGGHFPTSQLTRDHVIPRSRGGKNTWTNVVTACSRCNHHKGARTPEEASMPLLAVPFKPNLYEHFYLANHRILADQMDFLSNHFSQRRQWHTMG